MKHIIQQPSTKAQKDFFARNAELISVFAKIGIIAQIVSAFTEYSIIGEILKSNIPFLADISLQLSSPFWMLGAMVILLLLVFQFTKSLELVFLTILLALGLYTVINIWSTLDFATFFTTLGLETAIMFLVIFSVKRAKLKNQTGAEKWITGTIWGATLLMILVSVFLSLQGWNTVSNNHFDDKENKKQQKANDKYAKRRAEELADYENTETNIAAQYDPQMATIKQEYAAKKQEVENDIAYWQEQELKRKKRFTSKIKSLRNKREKLEVEEAKKIAPIQRRKTNKLSHAQNTRDNNIRDLKSKYSNQETTIGEQFTALRTGFEIGGGVIIIICLIVNIISLFIKTTILIESGIIKTPILSTHDVRNPVLTEMADAVTERIKQQTYQAIDDFDKKTQLPSIPKLPLLQKIKGDQPTRKINYVSKKEEIIVDENGDKMQNLAITSTDANEENQDIIYAEYEATDADAKSDADAATSFDAIRITKNNQPFASANFSDAKTDADAKKRGTGADLHQEEVIARIDRLIRKGQDYKGKLKRGEGRLSNNTKRIREFVAEIVDLKGRNKAAINYKNSKIKDLVSVHNQFCDASEKI